MEWDKVMTGMMRWGRGEGPWCVRGVDIKSTCPRLLQTAGTVSMLELARCWGKMVSMRVMEAGKPCQGRCSRCSIT